MLPIPVILAFISSILLLLFSFLLFLFILLRRNLRQQQHEDNLKKEKKLEKKTKSTKIFTISQTKNIDLPPNNLLFELDSNDVENIHSALSQETVEDSKEVFSSINFDNIIPLNTSKEMMEKKMDGNEKVDFIAFNRHHVSINSHYGKVEPAKYPILYLIQPRFCCSIEKKNHLVGKKKKMVDFEKKWSNNFHLERRLKALKTSKTKHTYIPNSFFRSSWMK
ncbi:hypothetical protein SNEBB_010446 [Seison nebaliae]|nr:hypothetical protein SNEBB_010446 [Seison nebaliae]